MTTTTTTTNNDKHNNDTDIETYVVLSPLFPTVYDDNTTTIDKNGKQLSNRPLDVADVGNQSHATSTNNNDDEKPAHHSVTLHPPLPYRNVTTITTLTLTLVTTTTSTTTTTTTTYTSEQTSSHHVGSLGPGRTPPLGVPGRVKVH